MRKLLCLCLTVLFLPIIAAAEAWTLGIDTPAEAIRPGKAFMLTFTVPSEGACDLVLRDVTGEYVMTVVEGLPVTAGRNQLWWNGTAEGVAPQEGVYQLALMMDGAEATATVVIGSFAPYLSSITPVKDAESKTMTVDFYASVDGLLSVGLWTGDVWSLLENRSVSGGMNRVTWDASRMTEDTRALTLTLTDSTGFCSNEEHIMVDEADFGITFATPAPAETPVPEDFVLTPGAELTPAPTQTVISVEVITPPPAATDEAADIDLPDTVTIDTPVQGMLPEPAPTLEATQDIAFTPSYGSAYPLTEKDAGTYWGTPMDYTDEEAMWQMLTAPITVIDYAYSGQRKIYAEPDSDSRTIGVVTGSSQGVRVIEHLDNGWSLIETYSSTFHDNSISAWNMLVQGYVKTSSLKTKTVDKKYHIVVDKLTQRLYLYGEGKLVTTLLVSTGLSNAKQPYNETRSGEFLYISPTGDFGSDNMVCPMGMKFNDGDLLHEVPYVRRSGSSSRIYSSTEPYLGQRASHGCIRVQRKKNADGYNMKWIWDHRKDVGRIVVWEDWQGRQVSYPAEDTLLYYNANGGSYYHIADHCDSAKDTVVFTPFTYAELDTGDFAKLEFCPYCAPALRRAEIDQINESHAPGGDHDPILTEARQKWLNSLIKKYGSDALKECELRYDTGDATP
ncbi:MAG: L,D-transpeptidase family protein [Clostridiales bacterium]|nr:L,D-transpeptidase family protein [Clostridiales bacterium]